ncbi:MAG: UDP-N-acetylmuramoyl-L-alanine--D-glutamate ligase [bacterium]
MKELANKKIAILGLGIENYWLVNFLLSHKIPCYIVICESRSKKELSDKLVEFKKYKNVDWILGKNHGHVLSEFEVVVRSPGALLSNPNLVRAEKAGAEITTAMNLFFTHCPSKNIIGVTGTKGKGTTASLIAEILKAGDKKVWLGGNIGVAPFEFFGKINKTDWVVLELSSFQLEDIKFSPRIAVWTNFYKEHLAPADPNNPNYHKNMASYWRSKLNIVKFQDKSGVLIANTKLKAKLKTVKTKKIFFTKSELPTRLVGEHNQENIAAAVEVASELGIKKEIVSKAILKFKGLEHRLEPVRELKKVRYYNDSFATTPESAIIALKSFDCPIIMLVGGADKGSNFKKLARAIKQRVKFVALLDGIATKRIEKELIAIKYPAKQMTVCKSMVSAVKLANRQALSNEVVLLSPACASFGMFKNYKERGKLFKQAVKKLR